MSITSAIKRMVARTGGPNRASRRSKAKQDRNQEKVDRKFAEEKRIDKIKEDQRKRLRERAEAVHKRAVARKAYAKKNDLKLSQVTNAMIGMQRKPSGWISKAKKKSTGN